MLFNTSKLFGGVKVFDFEIFFQLTLHLIKCHITWCKQNQIIRKKDYYLNTDNMRTIGAVVCFWRPVSKKVLINKLYPILTASFGLYKLRLGIITFVSRTSSGYIYIAPVPRVRIAVDISLKMRCQC